jgi:DNA-binding beta-propeller fold protein YncE
MAEGSQQEEGNGGSKRFKAQSAMEYLMTYGWAILIVAVVLGALYSLGIFNGSNFLGGTCIAAPGYLCSNPLLATDGSLSFTYGYQGPNVTIVGFGCTNTTTAPSSFAFSGSSDLEPGQEESVSAACTLSSDTLGTQFSGYLWVEYDQNGQSNLIARFATVRVASTTAGSATAASYILYVAINSAGAISIINTGNNMVVGTITGLPGAYQISVSQDKQYAYVSSPTSTGSVYVINIPNNQLIATIPNTGAYTWGVPTNPISGNVYAISNWDTAPTFVDINSQTDQIAYNSPLLSPSGGYGGPSGITSPDGSKFYLETYYSGSPTVGYLLTVSTSNDQVVNTMTIGDGTPHPPAITSTGSNIYIPLNNGASSSVADLNTQTHTITSIPISVSGTGEAAMTPNGANVYVTTETNPGYVVDISTKTDTVANVIGGPSLTDTFGIAITPDGKYVYADGYGSPYEVTVISTANNMVVNVIGLPAAPYGMAIV